MSRRLQAGAQTIGLLVLAACSTASPTPAPASTGSSPAVPATPTAGASPTVRSTAATPTPRESAPTVVEPTTTNTLPPPPRPSRPAPSTAGELSATSLPVPAGWKTIARPGGAEDGYQGNGTWVHGRDPRYAAHDVITLGCADVTRDDYPDPRAALEGSYTKKQGDAGIGLVLQFDSVEKASAYWRVYRDQVSACTAGDGPVSVRLVKSDAGLIDQRTYPDGDWTEVGQRAGARVTLIILTDPGHRITKAQSESLLRQIPAD